MTAIQPKHILPLSPPVYNKQPIYLGAAMAIVGIMTVAASILFFGHPHIPENISHAIGRINPYAKGNLLTLGVMVEIGVGILLFKSVKNQKAEKNIRPPFQPRHKTIHYALYARNREDIRYYFEKIERKELDVNTQDSTGRTALVLAAIHYPQAIRFLLKLGADPLIKDKEGLSALDYNRKLRVLYAQRQPRKEDAR